MFFFEIVKKYHVHLLAFYNEIIFNTLHLEELSICCFVRKLYIQWFAINLFLKCSPSSRHIADPRC